MTACPCLKRSKQGEAPEQRRAPASRGHGAGALGGAGVLPLFHEALAQLLLSWEGWQAAPCVMTSTVARGPHTKHTMPAAPPMGRSSSQRSGPAGTTQTVSPGPGAQPPARSPCPPSPAHQGSRERD